MTQSIRSASFVLMLLIASVTLADEFVITIDGQSQANVVIGAEASERVRAASQTLSQYIHKISGAQLPVRTGTAGPGLVLGKPSDFESLPFKPEFKDDIFSRETYLMRSTPDTLYLLGATDVAVEHAVWDLLYRLGYRQFFPGENWEVMPRNKNLAISVDTVQSPSFIARRIFYGYGLWGYNDQPFANWVARNRMSNDRDGFVPRTQHAYASILKDNPQVFDDHPEYLPLLNTDRKRYRVSIKFCTSNRELRQFIVRLAIRYFEQRPNEDCVSVDPSDLGNWCQCKWCAAQGSITDRAVSIVNEVAAAVNHRFTDKFVGMQAYHQHAVPPTHNMQPNVIVGVATSLTKGGMTTQELMAGWRQKGALLSVREYYGFIKWHWDLPGTSRASNPRGIAASLKRQHDYGAQFLNAESSDNWGPNGLGYYIASRVAWDASEADRVEELIDDFLNRSFGPAYEPMKAYYELNDAEHGHKLTDEHMRKMFRCLDRAWQLAKDDPEVLLRLRDLVLYLHYVELYRAYRSAGTEVITKQIQIDAPPVQHVPEMEPDDRDNATKEFMADLLDKPASVRKATLTIKTTPRREAQQAMVRYAYRIRKTMMVHSKGIFRVLTEDSKIPGGIKWYIPEGRNPWKSDEPITDEEVMTILNAGASN